MSRGGDWIHPPTRYAIMWYRDGGRCLACNMRPPRFGPGLSLDHLDPAKRSSDPENLVTLCARCNARKYDKTAAEAFGVRVALYLFARAQRPLTVWHRSRGYAASIRTGRYRVAFNVKKCKAYRIEQAYRREERAAIRAEAFIGLDAA